MMDNAADSLFGDILEDLPVAPENPSPLHLTSNVPVAGVHREIIEAKGTGAEGSSHMGWKAVTRAGWGFPEARHVKGWRSTLQTPVSLRDLEKIEDFGDQVTLVSRKVRGEWRTGSSDLDRDAVLQLVEDRGYVKRGELPYDGIQWVEWLVRE